MSEDASSVNKLSGVWMQIDAILHRENRANIWDRRDYSKAAPRKKEQLKLRSKDLFMCHPHLYELILDYLIIIVFSLSYGYKLIYVAQTRNTKY